MLHCEVQYSVWRVRSPTHHPEPVWIPMVDTTLREYIEVCKDRETIGPGTIIEDILLNII